LDNKIKQEIEINRQATMTKNVTDRQKQVANFKNINHMGVGGIGGLGNNSPREYERLQKEITG